jgi:hypothetical protein
MWAAIISAVMAIINWLCNKGGDAASATYSTVKEVGGGIIDGVVGWFTDDTVSTATKIAAITAAGYVIAPGATKTIVGRIGDGIADVGTTLVGATDTVASSIFNTSTIKWILLGVGAWFLLKE